MTDPDWPELRITDADIDAPEEAPNATSAEYEPTSGRPPRPGLGLRWCAGLAGVALLAAAGAVAFAEHRGRTVTTTRYQSSPAHTIDAGGCPNGDNCSPLDGLFGGLASAIDADLPAVETLFASQTIDTSSTEISRIVRIVELHSSHVKVAVLTQCRTGNSAGPSRTSGLTGRGPKLAVVIRPYAGGCSIAVLADLPAGVPVPASQLQALAMNPEARGQ